MAKLQELQTLATEIDALAVSVGIVFSDKNVLILSLQNQIADLQTQLANAITDADLEPIIAQLTATKAKLNSLQE